MLLFLDITRDQGTFRVQVHQRKDSEYPYQLKVNSLKKSDHVITHNIKHLQGTSYGIRELIWYHLQVRLAGGELSEVYFTDDKVVIDPKPKPFVAQTPAQL